VLEITAERASVLRATRILGSGPVSEVITGVGMTGMTEVDGGVIGHSVWTRRGRLSSFDCC